MFDMVMDMVPRKLSLEDFSGPNGNFDGLMINCSICAEGGRGELMVKRRKFLVAR